MSKKDQKIEQLEEMLRITLTAFEDAMVLLFGELIEHSKHHDGGPTPEEMATNFAEYMATAQAEQWSPHEIVHVFANHLGVNLLSQTQDMLSEVGMFIVKPGQSVTDVIKEQIANGALPEGLGEAFQSMLDSGAVDQIDAQVHDLRAQGNSHLN